MQGKLLIRQTGRLHSWFCLVASATVAAAFLELEINAASSTSVHVTSAPLLTWVHFFRHYIGSVIMLLAWGFTFWRKLKITKILSEEVLLCAFFRNAPTSPVASS